MSAKFGVRMAVSLAGLAVATGCVSTSPEDALAPFDTPASWAALSQEASGGAGTVTQDWLGEIQDPGVSSLVGEAILYNNNLAASAARVRAARERSRIALSGMLPSVGAFADFTRSRSPEGGQIVNGQFVPTGGYGNSTRLGANLSWEVDLWGRLTDGTRASYLDAKATELDFAAAQLSIAGGTAQAYYALTEARLQRQLSERDVQTGNANLNIIERRYERGISSSLDVRLARSSLASSRATLVARQQAEREAARRLEVLLGRYPGAEIAAASDLPTLDPILAEGTAGVSLGNPEDVLFRRPDVISAEARLKAAGLRVSEARKAFIPSLSLSGNIFDSGDGFSDLAFNWDDAIAQASANLVQPLFQGGRLRANAAAAKATMEAALYDYGTTVLSAYEEVENAIAAERFLSQRTEAVRLAYEEAVAAEELTNRQYLNGTTNIFNLINAQQRRISSESQYIAAVRSRLSNRIDLYLALGAPFEAPIPARAAGDENIPVEAPAPRGWKGVRL